jgi:hypothetical protein
MGAPDSTRGHTRVSSAAGAFHLWRIRAKVYSYKRLYDIKRTRGWETDDGRQQEQ